ncbi:hypothetical protein H7200_03270 [Candidatus Saccharibacteria bacterium]|nr:hypothetical protein [Candidatus Saccharibacteria bacterium]
MKKIDTSPTDSGVSIDLFATKIGANSINLFISKAKNATKNADTFTLSSNVVNKRINTAKIATPIKSTTMREPQQS